MWQWFKDLKLNTKILLTADAALAVLWFTPTTHDLILQVIGPHPRVTALVALLAGAYAVLHNPAIQGTAETK